MNSTAGAAVAALKARLATIHKSSGYHVTIAGVFTGRAALAIDPGSPLPAITLHNRMDRPRAEMDARNQTQAWMRELILVVHCAATETWDETLDLILDDIRQCLFGYAEDDILYGEIQFNPPADSSSLATLQMILTLAYEFTVYADDDIGN